MTTETILSRSRIVIFTNDPHSTTVTVIHHDLEATVHLKTAELRIVMEAMREHLEKLYKGKTSKRTRVKPPRMVCGICGKSAGACIHGPDFTTSDDNPERHE